MSLLVAIILGAIVGWLAAAVTGRNVGVLGSIAIGILGALLGGFLSTVVIGNSQSYLDFSWAGVFWSFIGALLLALLLNSLQAQRNNRI